METQPIERRERALYEGSIKDILILSIEQPMINSVEGLTEVSADIGSQTTGKSFKDLACNF